MLEKKPFTVSLRLASASSVAAGCLAGGQRAVPRIDSCHDQGRASRPARAGSLTWADPDTNQLLIFILYCSHPRKFEAWIALPTSNRSAAILKVTDGLQGIGNSKPLADRKSLIAKPGN